jgi:hypothetical protein
MGRTYTKFHTSTEGIKEPNEEGRFGKGIFFSNQPYYMAHSENPSLYSLDINEDDVIDASSFFYRDDYKKLDPIVKKIMKQFGVDEDTAQNLLSGHSSLYDLADDIENFDYLEAGEGEWDLQKYAGEAAELLGFKGVNLRDETGTSTLMNIFHALPNMRKIE